MEPKIPLSHEIQNLLAAIDEFRGRWQALKAIAPERLRSLQTMSTIESIGSSTRIEGARLSDSEVARLLGGLGTHSFKNRDEQEVAGYAKVLETVFESYQEIGLTENHVKQLHGQLLKYVDKDERHRGEYKRLANHIQAQDAAGNVVGVIFETASPFDTPGRMHALVKWARKALDDRQIHPLLVIGAFVLHFLAIHPFQDGNGRLARVLTNLLLLQAGYAFVPYASLERVVEENKKGYYLSLRLSQKEVGKSGEDLTEWILFFLKMILAQIKILETKVQQLKQVESLPPLQAAILDFVRIQGQATIGQLLKATAAKRPTLSANIAKLAKAGLLKQEGKTKGAFYRLP